MAQVEEMLTQQPCPIAESYLGLVPAQNEQLFQSLVNELKYHTQKMNMLPQKSKDAH